MVEKLDLYINKTYNINNSGIKEPCPDNITVSKKVSDPIFESLNKNETENLATKIDDNKTTNPKLLEYGIDINKPFEVTEEMIKKIKSKGKKGFFEGLKEVKKNGIPFASGVMEIADTVQLLSIIKKQENGEKLTKDETEKLYLYLLEQVENEHRGSSFWGKVGEGLSHMPAFAGEFMLTGGIYSLGKTAATKAGTKVLSQIAKKQLGKYLVQKAATSATAKFAGKVATVAAGAAARTFVLSNTYSGIAQRRLDLDTSEMNKNGTGKISLKENKESVSTSVAKGFLDGYIESVSEQSGAGFNYVLSKPLKKLPVVGKLLVPSLKTQKFMAKTGFNGLFEEYAEERLGGALRAVTGLDERKDISTAQKLYDAILPGWEQTGVELATTVFWSGGMHAVHSTVCKIDENPHEIKEKTKDVVAQTINTGTQLATEIAPILSVSLDKLPAMPLALTNISSSKIPEFLGFAQAGVKTDSINESSISSKPPLETVEQSTKSDVVSTMQPQKVKIAELLNDTVYIFENPKFYQFFIENKDLMIQTIKSYYDIKPWGENTKERKIIPEFTKNVSEKHLALLCDPGIISHLDDFYNFVKNFNGDINEISSLDLRKRFSDFLGTQKYYRGMILTEEQANKLKEKGITPNNFSGNYATETLAGIMLHSKKNYRNFMWDKVDGYNNGNPLISVTKLEKVAKRVPLRYHSLEDNKNLYVFELELPKINVIEPKGIFEVSYGLGFWDKNGNTIPNEDVESFIPFYISPDCITSVHEIQESCK